MIPRVLSCIMLAGALLAGSAAAEKQEISPELILKSPRILFLGNSITYAGEYIEFVETYIRLRHPESRLEWINMGLPSETVSGLSEPGHAGGSFPRPDLHERLDRVLATVKPNLVFACYGMNDGIYHPFSEERFQNFKNGIVRLRDKVTAAGAKIVHLTPPTFDPVPMKGNTSPAGLKEYRSPYVGYNEVLDRYSNWLLQQREQGWAVIDIHFPMNEFLVNKRKQNPGFLLAGDGVHANTQGHWLMAREILKVLGAPSALVESNTPDALLKMSTAAPEIYKLVQQKQRVVKDAYITEAGHKRPGMAKGKPIEEAKAESALIDKKIEQLRTPLQNGPVDSAGRPLIRKIGTVDLDLVETTPIVFQNRLWRFEWVRAGYWNNKGQINYFRLRDHETGEATPDFAEGHEFGSAFMHDGVVYVTGTQGRSRINMFASRDLKNWERWPVLNDPRYGIFNTSICKADGKFVLMFEIDRPAEEAGVAFTARFLTSPDLREWKLTPPECNYAKDRYTAPHALRWMDGWYYNFYLEAHQGYEMRVVRSRDLVQWEASPLNPVLRHSPDDKKIANPAFTREQKERIANAVNLNNSDIDFCEWNGGLFITYSWGNQQGVEHLAEATYEGTLEQFLKGWFPEKQ